MRSIVFASTNQGKVAELRTLLGAHWQVRSAAEFPSVPEVEEDRDTFEGNATKKAEAFAAAVGTWALADDSGLSVDFLGGRPGVWSARYGRDDDDRMTRLLRELDGVSLAQRSARFICVLALAGPKGELVVTRGHCEGAIGLTRRGSHGFGYDPIFQLADGRSLAELPKEEKSAISHRGEAFRLMVPHLEALISTGRY
jgi:XTP/dITP diphosphohydrolase